MLILLTKSMNILKWKKKQLIDQMDGMFYIVTNMNMYAIKIVEENMKVGIPTNMGVI